MNRYIVVGVLTFWAVVLASCFIALAAATATGVVQPTVRTERTMPGM